MDERQKASSSIPTMMLASPTTRRRKEAGRFMAFLVVGGVCAAINLAIVTALTLLWRWDYLPAALIATEVSVFIGFLLNDRFTFQALAGSAGNWWARCLRYHGGYALSQVLTIGLSLAMISVLGIIAAVAHGISLVIVTLVNYGFQRYFTYSERA